MLTTIEPSAEAKQSHVLEPANDADAEADSDDNARSSPVPQVMVGPDGNIILNPGRWLAAFRLL